MKLKDRIKSIHEQVLAMEHIEARVEIGLAMGRYGEAKALTQQQRQELQFLVTQLERVLECLPRSS